MFTTIGSIAEIISFDISIYKREINNMCNKQSFKPNREFFIKLANIELHWWIDNTDIEFYATPMQIYLALFDLNRILHTSKYASLYDFVNLLAIEDDGLFTSFDPRNDDLMKGWSMECFEFDDYYMIDLDDDVPETIYDDDGNPAYLLRFTRPPGDVLYGCDYICEECPNTLNTKESSKKFHKP